MTMARTVKLYKLDEKPATPGLRPMVKADVPEVSAPPKLLQMLLDGFIVGNECDCTLVCFASGKQ